VKGQRQQLTDSYIYTTVGMGIANSFGAVWTVHPARLQYRTWWCGSHPISRVGVRTPDSGRCDWPGPIDVQTWTTLTDAGCPPARSLTALHEPFDLRPDLLEAFRPDQLFKLATIARIRVQFLRDQPT
jgi:hypothetical protein